MADHESIRAWVERRELRRRCYSRPQPRHLDEQCWACGVDGERTFVRLETGYVCDKCFVYLKSAYDNGRVINRPYHMFDDDGVDEERSVCDRSRRGRYLGMCTIEYDGGWGSETLNRFDKRFIYRRSE